MVSSGPLCPRAMPPRDDQGDAGDCGVKAGRCAGRRWIDVVKFSQASGEFLFQGGDVHVGLQHFEQRFDIFPVHVLHRKAQPARFHMLQVGVQFQCAVFVQFDDQGKGLVVLCVPCLGLISGDAGQRNIDETLLPYTATLVNFHRQGQFDAGKATFLSMRFQS